MIMIRYIIICIAQNNSTNTSCVQHIRVKYIIYYKWMYAMWKREPRMLLKPTKNAYNPVPTYLTYKLWMIDLLYACMEKKNHTLPNSEQWTILFVTCALLRIGTIHDTRYKILTEIFWLVYISSTHV